MGILLAPPGRRECAPGELGKMVGEWRRIDPNHLRPAAIPLAYGSGRMRPSGHRRRRLDLTPPAVLAACLNR